MPKALLGKFAMRSIVIGLVAVFSLILCFFAAPAAFAQGDPYGLKTTADNAGLETGKDVPAIIGNVIGTGLSMISVLFFGLMLYAGIKWMISRGNEEEAKKALDTMIAAAIGIVIVMASYALTTFVFKSVGSSGGGGALSSNSAATEKKQEQYCLATSGPLSGQCSSVTYLKSQTGSAQCPGVWYETFEKCAQAAPAAQ